jgi:hypothetical protein
MPPQPHSGHAEPSRGGAPAGAGTGQSPTVGEDPAGRARGPRAGSGGSSTEPAVDGVRDGSGSKPAAGHGAVTKIGRAEQPALPRWIAHIWPAVAFWSWHPIVADEPLTAGLASAPGPEGGGSPGEASSAPEGSIGDSKSFADLVLPVAGGSLGERIAGPLAGYGPVGGAGLSFDFILLAVLTVLVILLVFAPAPSAWARWRH